jgi:transglutaminase-like putative cysteine protease
MPQFKIHHVTRYTYETPVRDSANQVMLFPLKDEYQEVLKQDLTITGEPPLNVYKDYYGNDVGSFMYSESHEEMVIDSKVDVITKSRELPAINEAIEEQWEHLQSIRFQIPYIDFLKPEMNDVIDEIKRTAPLEASRSLTPLDAAQQLNKYVYHQFKYIKGVTTVETTPDEIWKLKAGVCQDFAHILLVMLRIMGIPARYVSGYICPNQNGMRGEGATHAWTEAWMPSCGWLGLDPTNNCLANDLHVRLAVGRSFNDCSPVKGTYKGPGNHTLEVGVSVRYEDGHTVEDSATILTPQPVKVSSNGTENSYRKYLEMIQQQQQQQQ